MMTIQDTLLAVVVLLKTLDTLLVVLLKIFKTQTAPTSRVVPLHPQDKQSVRLTRTPLQSLPLAVVRGIVRGVSLTA